MKSEYQYLRNDCFEVNQDGTKTKLYADRFSREPTESKEEGLPTAQSKNKPTRAESMA